MADLYRILGLDREADLAAIKRAYRQRAKRAHPDVGGDRTAWASVKLAYDVLIDPERRKRYDETGEYEEAKAENDDSKALEAVKVAIEYVLSRIGSRDPGEYDIIADAKRYCLEKIGEGKAANVECERGLKRINGIVRRISAKKGKPERITQLFQANIDSQKKAIESNNALIRHLEAAIQILNDHTFDFRSGPVSSDRPTSTSPKIGHFVLPGW